MQTLAKLGLASRAVIYFLIGGLALLAALHQPEGKTTDSKGAIHHILHQPMGTWLLILLSLGLFCYAGWRFLQAKNDEHHLGRRIGRVFAGLLHVGLGAYALNLVFWFSRGTGGASEQKAVRTLFSLPFGDWLVGAVGLGVIGFGLHQIYFALTDKFRCDENWPAIEPRYVGSICKFGIAARGFVFLLVGTFFIQAAIKHSPREAGGFKDAWSALYEQPYGHWLVMVVALGLLSFAVFSAVEAGFSSRVRS
jgi:hypothetical protein